MTPLERITAWLATYPNRQALAELKTDYLDRLPGMSSLAPAGLVEVSRKEDVWGWVTVENQLNFALYVVLSTIPGEDSLARYNADWLMDFQQWVQRQSVRGLVPRFGNTDDREVVSAQNGAIIEQEDEGFAVYFVQLAVTYNEFYEE